MYLKESKAIGHLYNRDNQTPESNLDRQLHKISKMQKSQSCFRVHNIARQRQALPRAAGKAGINDSN